MCTISPGHVPAKRRRLEPRLEPNLTSMALPWTGVAIYRLAVWQALAESFIPYKVKASPDTRLSMQQGSHAPENHAHRCPFWFFLVEKPMGFDSWFPWWFNHLPGPSTVDGRNPAPPKETLD